MRSVPLVNVQVGTTLTLTIKVAVAEPACMGTAIIQPKTSNATQSGILLALGVEMAYMRANFCLLSG